MTVPVRARHAVESYAAVSRTSRVLGASPASLPVILLEELCEVVSVAIRHNDDSKRFEDECFRAVAILMTLEAGLDHRQGGDLADRLGEIYRHAHRCLTKAMTQNDPKWCDDALAAIAPIRDAWRAIV